MILREYRSNCKPRTHLGEFALLCQVFRLVDQIQAANPGHLSEALAWCRHRIREDASGLDFGHDLQFVGRNPTVQAIQGLTGAAPSVVHQAALAMMFDSRAGLLVDELQKFCRFYRIGGAR